MSLNHIVYYLYHIRVACNSNNIYLFNTYKNQRAQHESVPNVPKLNKVI